MISAIFINFQTILSKSSLTVGIYLKVLLYPFFKIQNTIRLPWYIDCCEIDHYLNYVNSEQDIERCESRP